MPFMTNIHKIVEEAKQPEPQVASNIVDDETGIDFMGGLVPAPLALPD